ncbi:hypothetical protein B0O99DRAFT_631880 [Bisporella sp. PMI_857]|nr:hypothetical protein B0O99DRAFT_631880 [Bisporella sp. PMI_857]
MSGFDELSQNVFGLVALIISLVALVTTILQILQQYFSTADGHRRCAESVMGQWAKGTHRRLRLREFRVEVIFETPVLFMAPPTNKRGPIPGREIHYLTGTAESYIKTKVLPPHDQTKQDEQTYARVHTADDEKASWVNLLSALQREEFESRAWDEKIRLATPKTFLVKAPIYGLAVALQSKTRSWDFIPGSITKPYATSTMCHMVEIMSMLGMHWKVFDQVIWNLRAEGNGFILTSTIVHGLGVMAVFATTGKSTFQDNRIIPDERIKELAFGTVPNIFNDEQYLEREKDAQSLELIFGTNEEVEETLEGLGCSADTLKKFSRDHKHIFSVSFEIIGMLGQVIRLRGSSFRMVPNPTSDYWRKKIGRKASWKITVLMEIFHEHVQTLILNKAYHLSHEICQISDLWREIAKLDCTDEANISIECREAIHDAADHCTAYLLSLPQSDVLSVLVSHITNVVAVLDNPNSPLNTIALINANKEDTLFSYYFDKIRPAVVDGIDKENAENSKVKEKRETIWVVLVFRMLCWLLLHDFHQADVKVVPSDLRGSRMPVFIG